MQKLNAEIRRALETSEVRDRLRHDGITPNRLDPKEFTAFVADELRRWGPIVRQIRRQERLVRGQSPKLDSEFVAFLFERLVDPAAVDGAGFDLLHRRGFLREDRPART